MKDTNQPAYRFGLMPHRLIAAEVGVTPHTVIMIEKRALKKFKAGLARRGLKLDDVLPNIVGH